MNLPEHVHKGIIELAQKYGIEKVILFGSRARGDNWERSDVDDLDRECNEDLLAAIRRDGVVLYEV